MIIVPQIKDPELTIGTTRTALTGAVIDYNIDNHDHEIRRSVINGAANMVSRGEFFIGTIDWHNVTLTQYTALKGLVGTVTRLWPLGYGPIPPAGSNKFYPYVDVMVAAVTPYHKNKALYMDAVIISFQSEKPYTLTQRTDQGWVSET